MKAIEVVFTINEETGELSAEVKGAQGPECLDEVLAGLDGLLGEPSRTVKKPEWNRREMRNVGRRLHANGS